MFHIKVFIFQLLSLTKSVMINCLKAIGTIIVGAPKDFCVPSEFFDPCEKIQSQKMCWSQTSSFCFALLGAAMSIDQTRRMMQAQGKTQRTALFAQVLLYLTYTLMETLQFLQYWFGLTDSCNTQSNKILTICQHLLIWVQPLSHNFWCWKNTLKGKSVFKFCFVTTLLCLVVSSISLYAGYNGLWGHTMNTNHISASELLKSKEIDLEITPDAYTTEARLFGVPLQNIGSSMCSYRYVLGHNIHTC